MMAPTVELYLGTLGWVNITALDDVRQASGGGGITITRGRQNEGQQVDHGKATLVINNAHGKYSPRNPRSPYYGLLGRNTPIRISEGTSWRFYGEVSSWPSRWSLSGRDVWVPIEAAGILRRLGQGAKPLQSAAYRAITRTSPVAYWPCEDADGAITAASAIPGVAAMAPMGEVRFQYPVTLTDIPAAGPPKFGSGQAPGGSGKVIDLASGGMLRGFVPVDYTFEWQIDWVAAFPPNANAAEESTVSVLEWRDAGTYAKWEFVVGDKFCWVFHGNDSGNSGSGSVAIELFNGNPYHFRMTATTDPIGGVIVARLYINGVFMFQSANFVGAMSGATGGITEVRINPLEEKRDALPSIGHIAVWGLYDPPPGGDVAVGVHGWLTETASARISRLCEEQGVPVTVTGDASESAAMGAQRIATFLDLLYECQDADGGILYEQRDALGLAYRTHTTLENQTPVELDYAAGHISPPFEPLDDDDAVRNDVEVSRRDGGSARSVQETGPLSILAPPDGVGTYDESVTVNVYDDAQLPDQAGWRRHLGTWDESRYPRITIDLAAPDWQADPTLTALAVAVDSGDRVTVDNLPDWLPPGPADVLVQGYTEKFGDEGQRTITWNATPAGPYTIATADGDPRVCADGSTLAAPLSLNSLSFSLASTASNGVWTTKAANFPLDVRVGGEKVTLSAISGSTSPQTATISARNVNGAQRAWADGTEVDVWNPAIAAL